MTLHVVLYEPEIPANTGNVIRLCANMGAELHLIKPLGFELDDKRLKRAGLDYHEWANMAVHNSLDDCLGTITDCTVYTCTTKGTQNYCDIPLTSPNTVLIFGPETRGLPDSVLDQYPTQKIRIPMQPHSRSLNLSNSVAIIAYDVWRRLHFA